MLKPRYFWCQQSRYACQSMLVVGSVTHSAALENHGCCTSLTLPGFVTSPLARRYPTLFSILLGSARGATSYQLDINRHGHVRR